MLLAKVEEEIITANERVNTGWQVASVIMVIAVVVGICIVVSEYFEYKKTRKS